MGRSEDPVRKEVLSSIDWQVGCLLYRIDSLQSEIKRVADKDHPYPEPNIIFSALTSVLDARKGFLRDAFQTYSTSERRERALGNLESVVEELETVADLFGLAHRVDSARIPFEILRSLSWASICVLPGPCRALVRLDPAYNYSITSFREPFARRKNWLPFWKEAILDAKLPPNQTILLFGFPSPEVGSILVHGIAAHELGHILARQRASELDDILNKNLSIAKQKHIDQIETFIADQLIPPKESNVKPSDAYERASRRVELDIYSVADRWLQEMFADFLAARLVGPAFIAAFDRVILGFGRRENSHPPGQSRRLLILRFLRSRLSHIVDDAIWSPLFEAGSADGPSSDLLCRIANEVCNLSFEAVAQMAEGIPSPLDKDGTLLKEQIEGMQEHMEHLSPPSVPLKSGDEIETANMFWLLLYAAWHFRLNEERFGAFATSHGWQGDFARAEAALGNLVLHALESLELRFRWESYPGK
jgi:hypothetical protein